MTFTVKNLSSRSDELSKRKLRLKISVNCFSCPYLFVLLLPEKDLFDVEYWELEQVK